MVTAAHSNEEPGRTRAAKAGLAAVRYGIGGVLVLVGLGVLIINPGGFGVDGFAMSVGSGLSVLLLNFMYRVSLDSNDDREREEQARRYLAEHGHWPDEDVADQSME